MLSIRFDSSLSTVDAILVNQKVITLNLKIKFLKLTLGTRLQKILILT